MFAISPVLAGTFDAPDYFPASSNINAAASSTTAADGTTPSNATSGVSASDATNGVKDIDPRRYTKWDRTASQVADAPNFTFSDFLDTINPLQHIPVISSVYREITGDKINPVAHVAGDILYGGALGALSAMAGGVGAIGDALSESQSGKDIKGTLIASIFGDDDKSVQVADAKITSGTTANLGDPSSLAALAATAPVQQATLASLPTSGTNANSGTGIPLTQPKAIALDRSKMPFGGVINMGNQMEAQDRAIALSEGSHAMRLGHTIYTSPLMNGEHPMPAASTVPANPTNTVVSTTSPISATASSSAASIGSTQPAAPPAQMQATASAAPPPSAAASTATASAASASTDATSFGPHKNAIPQNLIDDMVMMKALNQYKGVAAGPASLGSNFDMSN